MSFNSASTPMVLSDQQHEFKGNNTHTFETKILGHRGARGARLENSYDGFDYLQQLYTKQPIKCDFEENNEGNNLGGRVEETDNCERDFLNIHPHLCGVEFDVQMTADTQLVVFHDDNLNRIYGLDINVYELSMKDLLRLTQKNPAILPEYLHDDSTAHLKNNLSMMPLMPLKNIWDFMRGFERIEVEVKTHNRTNIKDLVSALSQSLHAIAHPITLTSFDTSLIDAIQSCSKLNHHPVGLLVETNELQNKNLNLSDMSGFTASGARVKDVRVDIVKQAIEKAQSLRCRHIGFEHTLIDTSTLDLCQERDFTVSAWTVNDPKRFVELATMNVDYIITDFPERMLFPN